MSEHRIESLLAQLDAARRVQREWIDRILREWWENDQDVHGVYPKDLAGMIAEAIEAAAEDV